MESKTWKTSVLYYGCAIGLMAIGLVLLNGRSRPVGKSQADPSAMRIVSLAPNLTEILFSLGLSDHIVAVSSDSSYPPEAEDLKKVGSFWNPDLEEREKKSGHPAQSPESCQTAK